MPRSTTFMLFISRADGCAINAPIISKIDIKTNILNVQGVNKIECPAVKKATNMLTMIAKTTTDE